MFNDLFCNQRCLLEISKNMGNQQLFTCYQSIRNLKKNVCFICKYVLTYFSLKESDIY
jgi:hypothetical protein